MIWRHGVVIVAARDSVMTLQAVANTWRGRKAGLESSASPPRQYRSVDAAYRRRSRASSALSHVVLPSMSCSLA
jgi:hypothetical protein